MAPSSSHQETKPTPQLSDALVHLSSGPLPDPLLSPHTQGTELEPYLLLTQLPLKPDANNPGAFNFSGTRDKHPSLLCHPTKGLSGGGQPTSPFLQSSIDERNDNHPSQPLVSTSMFPTVLTSSRTALPHQRDTMSGGTSLLDPHLLQSCCSAAFLPNPHLSTSSQQHPHLQSSSASFRKEQCGIRFCTHNLDVHYKAKLLQLYNEVISHGRPNIESSCHPTWYSLNWVPSHILMRIHGQ